MASAFIAPVPAVAQILQRYDRATLTGFIAIAIDWLDWLDGDPDEEADGDEFDHNQSEDDFIDHERGFGPGCRISDDDHEFDGQERREHAHSEWG